MRPYLVAHASARMLPLAGAVAAAAAAILVSAGSGHGGRTAAPPGHTGTRRPPAQGLWIVDTARAKLLHTSALPRGVYGGSTGGGFAWMADGAGVAQLDETTGRVIRTYGVRGGAIWVAYARRSLWVTPRTSATPFLKALVEIDLHTGARRSIAVPGSYDSVFAGDGYVWVPGERHIDRIDPATGRIDGAIRFGLSQPNLACAMTFTPGALWIASAARDQLLRVDPTTMRVVARGDIPDTGDPDYCVTAGAGKIWVGSDQASAISSFDPRTVRPTRVTLRVGHLGWMAGARDELWFATSREPATLRAVSGSGAPRAQLRLPFPPLGFTVAGDRLYAGFVREPA